MLSRRNRLGLLWFSLCESETVTPKTVIVNGHVAFGIGRLHTSSILPCCRWLHVCYACSHAVRVQSSFAALSVVSPS